MRCMTDDIAILKKGMNKCFAYLIMSLQGVDIEKYV